jgi:UDP-N-acetylmuramate dehydrogenase
MSTPSNPSDFLITENVSLSEYVSWKSSGIARHFFEPSSLENLQAFLQQLDPAEPLLWLGLGSNLLVRDGGFEGTVIFTQKYLRELKILENNQLYAECGVACPTFARFAVKHNLVGGEWFAGVPGTIGGALAMNAGAFGGETWEHVISAQCIDRQGRLHTIMPSECTVSYRSVKLPEELWFVGATFQLTPGNKEEGSEKIKQMLEKRAQAQPTGVPTCGSVFRNPPGDYAGRLIQASGLREYAIGDAKVSDKHANFIVNIGAAKPSDIEALIHHIAAVVLEKQGIQLETEVKIVGNLKG